MQSYHGPRAFSRHRRKSTTMYVPPQYDRNVEIETTAASFIATSAVLAVMPSISTNELIPTRQGDPGPWSELQALVKHLGAHLAIWRSHTQHV